jgi:hypothetical protein
LGRQPLVDDADASNEEAPMRRHPILLSTIVIVIVLIASAGVLYGCGERATLPVQAGMRLLVADDVGNKIWRVTRI